MTKGGSGIYLNANDKDAFEHFINHSDAVFMKTGAYGITYNLTLRAGVQSQYLSLDAHTYSQPITNIILKTVFIYPLSVSIEIINPTTGKKEKKRTTPSEDFYEEVNIQTDVYLKTMDFMDPLCPAIVYANILDLNDPLIHLITSTYSPDLIQNLNSYPGIKLGIIAMEIVPDAQNLYYNMQTKPYFQSYVPKALHTLIEFTVKTGYFHGDFHSANMIVSPNVRNYFWGRSGKISIIDFGFSEKLSQPMYARIKALYKNKKYTDILDLLCDIPRKDGFNLNKWEGYTVMCLKTPPKLTDDPNYVIRYRNI